MAARRYGRMILDVRTIVLSVIGFLITVVLGYIDYLTGPELSITVFYLVPIIAATWFVGLWSGIAASVAAGLTWLAADAITHGSYTQSPVHYWNALVEIAIFTTVAVLLSSLKQSLLHETQRARTDYLTGLPNGRYFAELADAGAP